MSVSCDGHQACQMLLQVKQQIVLSATEAAEMILRVDDIIKVCGAAHLHSHFDNVRPSYLCDVLSICMYCYALTCVLLCCSVHHGKDKGDVVQRL